MSIQILIYEIKNKWFFMKLKILSGMNDKKLSEVDEMGSAVFDLQESLKNFIIILNNLQKDIDKIKSVLKID